MNILKKLFKNHQSSEAKTTDDPKSEQNKPVIILDEALDCYIREVEKLLSINMPQIRKCEFLYSMDKKVHPIDDLATNTIPDGSTHLGGYYYPPDKIIVISTITSEADFDTNTIEYKAKTPAELLLDFIHEYRHAWQDQKNQKEFPITGARGKKILIDPGEIDADAFSLAFVLSDKTPFTAKDFPTSALNICLHATADNGKRWARAKELSAEYHFNSTDKIEELRKSVHISKDLLESYYKDLKIYPC